MESKEFIAILAAVLAVCLIIAVGRAIRGTEESSAPEKTTVSSSATTETTDIWDKLRDEKTTPENTDETDETGSNLINSIPVDSESNPNGLIVLGTTLSESAASTTTTTTETYSSATTKGTVADTFVIVQ